MSLFRSYLQKLYLFFLKKKLSIFVFVIFFFFSWLFSTFLNYFVNFYNYQNVIVNKDKKKILYDANNTVSDILKTSLEKDEQKINKFYQYLTTKFFSPSTGNKLSINDFVENLKSDQFKEYFKNFLDVLVDSLKYIPKNLHDLLVNFLLETENNYIQKLADFSKGKEQIIVNLNATCPQGNLFLDIESNLSSNFLFYNGEISKLSSNCYQIINKVSLPLPSNISLYFDPNGGDPKWFPFNPFVIGRNFLVPLLRTIVSISFSYDYSLSSEKISNEKIFWGPAL